MAEATALIKMEQSTETLIADTAHLLSAVIQDRIAAIDPMHILKEDEEKLMEGMLRIMIKQALTHTL